MFLILDLDDVTDIKVVTHDCFADTPNIAMLFDTQEDADEYAERNLGEYQVVEIDPS